MDVVVFGSAKAGVSTLVRSLIGVGKEEEEVNEQSSFRVATRLVKVGKEVVAVKLWEVDSCPEVDIPQDFAETVDGVVAVFNADSRESLAKTVARYESKFSASAPRVRYLVGNVHRHRSVEDTCEFPDAVEEAAIRHNMKVYMLSAYSPSVAGTRRLLEQITTDIWHRRFIEESTLQ